MDIVISFLQETPALFISLFEMVLHPQGLIAKAINAVILSLAALVLIWSLMQVLATLRAWYKLAALKKAMAKDKDKTWTPEEILGLVGNRAYATRRFRHKLQVVHRLREDVNAVLESVDHIDASLMWRAYGILKFPISSLIVFGLLGTVWGLQKAIYSMLPTLQGAMDLEQLRGVMLGTLTGMQTAFSTTLAGLVSSILLGFFILVALRTFFDRQLMREKQFLVAEMIPIFSPISAEQLKRVSDQTRELKQTLGGIANQSDLLFQPIVESANALKSSVDGFHSASHSIIEAGRTVEKFSGVLEGSLSQLTATLEAVSASMGTFRAVQTDIEGTVKNLKHLPEHFEALMTSLADEFKRHQTQTQDASDRLLEARMQELTAVIKSLSKQSDQWQRDNLKQVAAVSQAADDAMARVTTEVEQVVEKFVEVAKTIEKTTESGLRSVESLNAGHQKIGDAYLNEFKQKMETIHEKVKALIDKMAGDEQQRNQQIVNAMTEWVTYNQHLSLMLNDMKQLPRLIGSAVAGKG